MNFCGHCGNQLTSRWVAGEQRQRKVCERCGATSYDNPQVLVSCFVYWQDRLLMARRGIEPEVGKWTTPSGFMEEHETLQEAAARETLEETGVQLDPQRLELYCICNLPDISQVYVAFRVELEQTPAPSPGYESLEVALQSEAEIDPEQLAFHATLGNYPQHFFRQLRSGRFPIFAITLRAGDRLGEHSRVYHLIEPQGRDHE